MSDSPPVAVVTGAASGIGRAILARLAEDGFSVIAIDRDSAAIHQAVAEEVDCGRTARAAAFDIRDRSAIRDCFAEIGAPIHALVNNAGIFADRALTEISEAEFASMLEVNLVSILTLSQEALPHMPDGGRIINIASRSFMGGRRMAHYAASKGGVVSLTRAMAMDLAPRNIAVNAIAPGLIDTPLIAALSEERRRQLIALQPTGRMGRPEDVANVVAFLVAPRTQFITGEVLVVDGGKSLTG